MDNLNLNSDESEFKSAKSHEWAYNLWMSKKQKLINNEDLATSLLDIVKNIKIIFFVNPKFKKLKRKWMEVSEKKLAEMQIKTQNLSSKDKGELVESFQYLLELQLDELINEWLAQR